MMEGQQERENTIKTERNEGGFVGVQQRGEGGVGGSGSRWRHGLKKRRRKEYEENHKALRSWVRPVAMVTAARRNERQTDKTLSPSLSPSLSLARLD